MKSLFVSPRSIGASGAVHVPLALASLICIGCGQLGSAAPDEDLPPETEVAIDRAAATGGCVRDESRQAVGDAYDVLTGRSGSFPFPDNFTACWSALGTTTTDMRFFSDSYEFERSVSSGVTVDGEGSYGAYSANASVKNKVESKVTFSRNSIIFMASEEILKAKVTLDGDVRYSPLFEQYLAAGDKMSLHNTFGDVFTKTAYLGHSIRLIYVAEAERTSKYSKQDFEAVLKATYKAASVGGSVTVSGYSSTQVSEIASKMRTSVVAITRSTNIPEITEMTLGEVKGILATFRNTARTNGGVTVREELVPFGQHGGKSEAQFFDWRNRVASINAYERYYQQAKQIADLNTTFKNLAVRGRDGMTASQWYIDQFRTPAGYQGSGAGAAGFGAYQHQMKLDADEYRQIVAQSQRLVAKRQDNTCITVADGTAGAVGKQLAAKTCSNDDGQLFRYDSAAKVLRSVSGDCIDVMNGSATGNLVLATCGEPKPKSQQWTFSIGSRKIDTWSNPRDIYFVSNGFGPHIRAVKNQSANAANWSRSYYTEYSWSLAY